MQWLIYQCAILFPQILSRGQLVKYGRYQSQQHLMVSMILIITKEMLPSFRLIAYYHTNEGEIVSDSLRVDVKPSCVVPVRQHKTEFKFTILCITNANVRQIKESKGNAWISFIPSSFSWDWKTTDLICLLPLASYFLWKSLENQEPQWDWW